MTAPGKVDMFTRIRCTNPDRTHVSEQTVHYRLKGSGKTKCLLCHPLDGTRRSYRGSPDRDH